MNGVEADRGTCLITGVASGIGAATATLLLADGWRVVGIDLADDAPAGVDLISGDAADPDVIEQALRFGLGGDGRLTGLVCAAGVPPSGPWDDREHWSEVIRVDLTAPYEALRLTMPALAAAKGAAVLIGSISGPAEGSSRSPAYAAAKAGLEGLARSFAVIGAPDGVRVNVVAPGAIDTPFDTPAFPPDARPDVPLGRMGAAGGGRRGRPIPALGRRGLRHGRGLAGGRRTHGAFAGFGGFTGGTRRPNHGVKSHLKRIRFGLAFRAGRAAEERLPLDLLWLLVMVPGSTRALLDAIRIKYRPGRNVAFKTFGGRLRVRLGYYERRPLMAWVDRMAQPRWERRFQVDGRDRLEQILAERPVILLSLHTPSLMALPLWTLAHGIPTASVTLDDNWRKQPELLGRARSSGWENMAQVFVAGNARPMARYLTPGKALLVPADWVRGRSVTVAWRGRPLILSAGPFRLAKISGAVVLPVLAVGRGRWRYRIIIGAPVPDALIESGDVTGAASECTAQLLAELAKWPKDRLIPQVQRATRPPRPPRGPAAESLAS